MELKYPLMIGLWSKVLRGCEEEKGGATMGLEHEGPIVGKMGGVGAIGVGHERLEKKIYY